MPSKNESIEQVLVSYLQQYATTNSIDIAWFGEEYSPVIGKDYIEEQFIPSDPETVFLGRQDKQRHRGIYQLKVLSSSVNSAIANINSHAALLNEVFKVGYPINYNGVYLQIENFVERKMDYDDGWYGKVITILYRTEL